MEYLWKIVNRFVTEEYASAVFLAANITCWAVGTLVVGMFFCMAAGGEEAVNCIANVMCVAVYAAIIFGLFGGIIYLMRRDRNKEAGA